MSATTTENTKEISNKFADLIGPTDAKLDREIREALITARIGLLLKQPFFGNMATRLKLVNADEWCATAATDGRHFYYNSRFIKMLRPKEIEFLFGHEVLHCVYDHFGRRGDRDHQLFNIANDYCVYADLIKHKVGEKITTVPCLHDPKFDGMSSEEVYDILYEKADKIDIGKLLDQMIDEHLDGDDEGGGADGGNEEGKGKRPSMSAEERQRVRDEIKEAMIAAAHACENAGNIPAGVRRMIQSITSPQMNWREMLRMQLQSVIKSDYTFARMNRKGWHLDARLPGMKNTDAIDIAVAIDMSGSIGEKQGRDFLGEIYGIMESFDSYRIHVYCFDTEVYNPQDYTSENLESIEEYDLKGGGGTDFDCIFNHLKEENIEPKRLVVFTDGYPFGSWGDANYCDTLWIIHGDKNPEPPFGTFALYEGSE